ncbi:hypothetical protein KY317_02320 [Candidatus Woesearchaeota archaeon]|nr:hypothetical protein [Candidatus Woesearchaeota archaeon]
MTEKVSYSRLEEEVGLLLNGNGFRNPYDTAREEGKVLSNNARDFELITGVNNGYAVYDAFGLNPRVFFILDVHETKNLPETQAQILKNCISAGLLSRDDVLLKEGEDGKLIYNGLRHNNDKTATIQIEKQLEFEKKIKTLDVPKNYCITKAYPALKEAGIDVIFDDDPGLIEALEKINEERQTYVKGLERYDLGFREGPREPSELEKKMLDLNKEIAAALGKEYSPPKKDRAWLESNLMGAERNFFKLFKSRIRWVFLEQIKKQLKEKRHVFQIVGIADYIMRDYTDEMGIIPGALREQNIEYVAVMPTRVEMLPEEECLRHK